MFDKLFYHFRLLYFPFTVDKSEFNEIALNASYENAKKVRFIGIIYFFVCLISMINDFLRHRHLDFLDPTYSNHTIILLVSTILCSVVFLYKIKSLEEHKLHLHRNLFLAEVFLAFLVVVTAGLWYFELITFKKQATFSIFVVFINFVLLLNRYQKVYFNIGIFLVGCYMIFYLDTKSSSQIIDLISTTTVINIAAVISHHHYYSWKENIINKETLKKINTELELTNTYLQISRIQLVYSNNNLQDFVNAISHDLREPLRISNNLFEIIMIKGRNQFSDMELRLLVEVKANNKIMNTMLEDLLEFSKLGNHPNAEKVDLNRVVEKAMDILKNKIDKSQIQIHCDVLPVIDGAESEMLSLFQNLLNNSIKYRKHNIVPEVYIDYRMRQNKHCIEYKDNGIGIPENEIGNVFNIFYRAKNTKNFSGTGIGLSICKKIIKNLGGDIYIQSKEQDGIKITIQIPMN